MAKADKKVQKYTSLPKPKGCLRSAGFFDFFTPKINRPEAKRSAPPCNACENMTTLPVTIATSELIKTSIISTKKEMVDKIGELYGVHWSGTKYKDEAGADALAIHYVASQQSNVLKYWK